ncbi:hypothetical protein FP803_03385 [Candidatus Woesearchaeota archaeon]|nr:hypothetical protein [Candidatus Woesearchaeota archaeon]MBU3942068.1 hypothetical protein [Nanoarchaeota archaeon]
MKEKTKDSVKKFFKIILGLLLIIAGVCTYVTWYKWWPQLWTLIRGVLGLIIILIGLMFVFMGFSD